MNVTYLTADPDELESIDRFTDASQTVLMEDGSFAFCHDGGHYRTVRVQIPGYDYVYGEAKASGAATNAHKALNLAGFTVFPQGSQLFFYDPA